jgi:hypothetical protein
MREIVVIPTVVVLSVLLCSLAAPPEAFGSFEFPDFCSGPVEKLRLNPFAAIVDCRLRLVPEETERTGSAYYVDKQSIAQGFETEFVLQITGGDTRRSDGLAFVVQNESLSAIGYMGGQIGYAAHDNEDPWHDGIKNSVAVEFDTFKDSTWYPDLPACHVSIQSRGVLDNSANHTYSLGATMIPDLRDEQEHTARVQYVPGTLRVFLDNLDTPVLSATVDLAELLNLDAGNAWVGFTAANGSLRSNHDILRWEFAEVPEPATVLLLGLGALAVIRKRKG